MGTKNEVSFFIFCIHVLLYGVCTAEVRLSATSDVKKSVRQFAAFHIYIRLVLLKCCMFMRHDFPFKM